MKVTRILALASATGVIAASTMSVTALAWHPKGVIKKSVQNTTAAGQLSDANDASSAVSAKPGDVLKYVIEIRNDGQANDKGHNDMHFTKLTDTLPAGVELVSDPTKRTIAEDLGIVKPGQKVTKEYLVKVTSTKDGNVIKNEACFTGDSEVKDQPQKGCDTANVKVTVPPKEEPKPEQPAEEPKEETPTPTPAPTPTDTLPQTGPSSLIAPLAALTSGAAAYAGRLFVIKKRQK